MIRKIVMLKKERERESNTIIHIKRRSLLMSLESGRYHRRWEELRLHKTVHVRSHTKMTEIRKTESIEKVSPWKLYITCARGRLFVISYEQ